MNQYSSYPYRGYSYGYGTASMAYDVMDYGGGYYRGGYYGCGNSTHSSIIII